MTRFLIEVSQSGSESVSRKMDEAIRIMGSHFVTHADWHVKEGNCIGSLIAELNSEHEAFAMVPPNLRSNAYVYELEPIVSVH